MTLLSFRLAAREMRGGLKGFRIFLACLALGVAAIAAAGSTAEAFRQGLAFQARDILGGDLAATLENRAFTPAERAALAKVGPADFAAGVNAMAQAASGERHLIDLRGVSARYPLAGAVELQGESALAQALAPVGGVAGAAVEPDLLDRLHLRLGDRFMAGNVPLIAKAVLVSEPDRLSRGFALGPRVLTRLSVLETGRFLQPGIPFSETARIALPPGAALAPAEAALAKALTKAGPGGWRLRDRNDAAPGLGRLIDELEYFLAFIGLASLVAGGLGVSGAVGAYMAARTPSIATFKALGAEGALVRNVYLIQIAVLAVLGVAIGVAVGAAVPLFLGALFAKDLPIPALFAVYPGPLLRAAAFGLLSAAAFGLAPLARARATPPSALFRRVLSRPRPGLEIALALIAALGLAGLAVLTAPSPAAAGVMIAGVILGFAILWILGVGAAWAAGRTRGRWRGWVRIGMANLAGPGSAARTAAPAIGLGVALLTAVVLIQSSLLTQVAVVAPRTAPSLIFTSIPGARAGEFDATLAGAFGRPLTAETYLRAPFATGRLTAARGVSTARLRIAPPDRWAWDNDISISAIGPEPRGDRPVAGRWWPAAYSGPPLVALAEGVAKGPRLKVGDTLTVSLLGRDIEARVALIRRIDMAGFGANFPVVFDPAALAGADLDDVAIARASPKEEASATRALGAGFAQVNVISVREQLDAAAELFGRLSLAIRGAAGVATMAGLLVLAGAIAAGAGARAREAAVLKVMGAESGQILAAYALEYGVVGLIAGATGVALGALAAWPAVTQVFQARWSVDARGVGALVLGAAGLATAGGALAALQALRRRPAGVLRAG